MQFLFNQPKIGIPLKDIDLISPRNNNIFKAEIRLSKEGFLYNVLIGLAEGNTQNRDR